jgi:hypothetical protein
VNTGYVHLVWWRRRHGAMLPHDCVASLYIRVCPSPSEVAAAAAGSPVASVEPRAWDTYSNLTPREPACCCCCIVDRLLRAAWTRLARDSWIDRPDELPRQAYQPALMPWSQSDPDPTEESPTTLFRIKCSRRAYRPACRVLSTVTCGEGCTQTVASSRRHSRDRSEARSSGPLAARGPLRVPRPAVPRCACVDA